MRKISLSILIVVSSLSLASCIGGGGEDKPFIFGDNNTSTGGTIGSANAGQNGLGGANAGGASGGSSGTTVNPGQNSNGGTAGGVTGGRSGSPGVGGSGGASAGTCNVDFDATLALVIDDGIVPSVASRRNHYDSPPACCQYAGARSGITCPDLAAGNLNHYLISPSQNNDLYCCGADDGSEVTATIPDNVPALSRNFIHSQYCDRENRHGGVPELAVARWRPANNQKLRLSFDISPDLSRCTVTLPVASFPDFMIENSALDASLKIGANGYSDAPGALPRALNEVNSVGTCAATRDSSGNVQVQITHLNLRFFAQIYKNYTKCMMFGNANCGAAPFTERYAAGANPYEVIPGFNFDPLDLVTGDARTLAPLVPDVQSPLAVRGEPLHYDAVLNRSTMKMVTTVSLPKPADESISDTTRDDNLGTGTLFNQLRNANLYAAMEGTVTIAGTGQPFRNLESCGQGVGGASGSSGSGGVSGGPGGSSGAGGSGGAGGSSAVGGAGGSSSPAGLNLLEISPTAPEAAEAIARNPNPITFGEVLLRAETNSKLFKLVNNGSAALTIRNIQVVNPRGKQFRLGAIYRGANFASREWAVGQESFTLSPSAANAIYFFVNYGPYQDGSAPSGASAGISGSLRQDTAMLSITTSSGVLSLPIQGSAKNDTRARLALVIQDETRFSVENPAGAPAKPADYTIDAEGSTPAKHFYFAQNFNFSFRQDPAPREVYLVNKGASSAVDHLNIRGVSFTADTTTPARFSFTQDSGAAACFSAAADSTTACRELVGGTGADTRVKLGVMTFRPQATTTYQRIDSSFRVRAVSGATAVRPIIEGAVDSTGAASEALAYRFMGSEGAPSGTYDLRIHRVIAGFRNKVNDGLQPSLMSSTTTRGILNRLGNTTDQPEIFTIPNGLKLNPVRGTIVLEKIITPVDGDPNNPRAPSEVTGIRLYNSPGSQPNPTEYFAQCRAAAGHQCAFFYFFVGDWAGSTRAVCNERVPVSINPALSTPLTLNPETEQTCMSGPTGMQPEVGTFDPVTGHIHLDDVAIRLYAPRVPALNETVDATIRLSFTTGCVTPAKVPDAAIRSQYTVTNETLTHSDTNFYNETLMPVNPLIPYVGTGCAPGELHGRPMFQPDTTNTLDNGGSPARLNFDGFDIAGVGQSLASNSGVASATMNIVIKAEVGERRSDATE